LGGGPPGGFRGPGPGAGPGGGGVTLDPLVGLDDPGKPLRSGLLGIPSLRRRYLDHVRTIARDDLDWEVAGPLVARWRALIEDAVRADTRKLSTTEAFLTSTAATDPADSAGGAVSLRDLLAKRRSYLLSYRDPADAAPAATDPPPGDAAR